MSKIDSPRSPGLNQAKDRFAQKNSFYLDMGKTELNGRTDTLTNGSSNGNSVLLHKRGDSNASVGSGTNPDSPSTFSKQQSLFKRSRSLKPFNPMPNSGGGQSVLKAAIFRNMQKNNGDMASEDGKEDTLKVERRHSDNTSGKNSDHSSDRGYESRSPDRDSQDESSDDSPKRLEKIKALEKSGIKQSQAGKRRFLPFAQKNVVKTPK